MIYEFTPEHLKTVTPVFDFGNPPIDPEELVANLKETMKKHYGLGLACTQVGLPYNCFLVGDPREPSTIKEFFNANIVHQDGGAQFMLEGCLSFPGLFIKIKRPNGIRMRYQDAKGEIHTSVYTNLTAHVVQHELDHVNGIVFQKRANRYHLEQAEKKLRKEQKAKTQYSRIGATNV